MSSIGRRKSKDDTILIEDEQGTTIEDDHEAADGLNKKFCSIGIEINSLIETPLNKVNITQQVTQNLNIFRLYLYRSFQFVAKS